ncbi:MAG: hypothetical protein ACYC19_10165 [Acidimicrobiales bacterium]
MTLAIEVIIVVLVVLALGVGLLRYRKVHQDHVRGDAMKPTRLVAPPPSPYATSKGFRLVDTTNEVTENEQRSAPARPRLEPSREYVFGESQMPAYDVEALAQLRHDERWALSRSARRAKFTPSVLRKLAVVVLVVLVLAVGAFYFFHPTHTGPSTGTNSTSTTTKTGMAPTSGVVTPYASTLAISLRMNAST